MPVSPLNSSGHGAQREAAYSQRPDADGIVVTTGRTDRNGGLRIDRGKRAW